MLDYSVKMQRARRHLKELETAEEEWRNLGAHSFWTEPDPGDEFGRTVFLATAEPPPRYPISVILGDWLHTMRSALDCFAMSLAEAHTNPLSEDARRASEFPIFGDEDSKGTPGKGPALFHDGRRKIGSWHPGARSVVEALQPYQRGPDFRDDPLWILHELDRLNKHRALHLTAAWSDAVMLDASRCENVDLTGETNLPRWEKTVVYDGTVGDRTEIGRMILTPLDPVKPMHIEVQRSLRVMFGPTLPNIEGASVVQRLDQWSAEIYHLAMAPLESFL